jgi:hypothetical protein
VNGVSCPATTPPSTDQCSTPQSPYAFSPPLSPFLHHTRAAGRVCVYALCLGHLSPSIASAESFDSRFLQLLELARGRTGFEE